MLAIPAGPGTASFAVGRAVYQLARVSTYGVLGLVFGIAGGTLRVAGIQQWVSVGLGVALLAGLFLSPRLLEMPWLVGGVGRLKSIMAGFLRRRTLTAMAILGALNGLLPCGLVYVACAGAAGAGDAVGGGIFMLAFGAGTLPITLGIGLSGQLIPAALRRRFRHAVPLGVALMGCLLIVRGLGLNIPYLSPLLGIPCH